jgi:hypothetical protein
MRNSVPVVGLDDGFVCQLLLFIGQIRNQKMEESNQLGGLFGQPAPGLHI